MQQRYGVQKAAVSHSPGLAGSKIWLIAGQKVNPQML